MGEIRRTGLWMKQFFGRRMVLKLLMGAGFALSGSRLAVARTKEPRKMRPQENDQFVFAQGDNQGQVITPQDIPLGGPQVFAYPYEPVNQVVRDGSRFNKVMLVRFKPEEISEPTQPHTTDGIIAYSAVCTHAGCPVVMWIEKSRTMKCPCHYSEYGPDKPRYRGCRADAEAPSHPASQDGGRRPVCGEQVYWQGWLQAQLLTAGASA